MITGAPSAGAAPPAGAGAAAEAGATEARRATLVLVGASLGGVAALEHILGGLPRELARPIVVVQHRGKGDGGGLVEHLAARSALRVREVEDKDELAGGTVYVAPSDYHVLVDGGALALSTDPLVNYARPSIDVLFESGADSHGAGVMAVLLTGANEDGARGLARVKRAGGFAVVQDPATAECPVMPSSALRETDVDAVLSLDEIVAYVGRAASAGGR